jgi:ankyrin repeat protein
MNARRLLLAGLLCAALPLRAAPARLDDYFRAVSLNDADGVRELLAAGVDPNTVEPVRGENGLIVAIRDDAMRSLAVLLAWPGVDPERGAANGNTALMMAAYKGNIEAVKALLERGAKTDKPGWTPLHYAAANGSEEIVRLLLAHGARAGAQAPQGMTPLMMAAREGHAGAVALLVAAGAQPAAKSAEGARAVDYAAFAGHRDLARELMKVTPGPAPAPPAPAPSR